ncbi:MAG TPA: hypothetical protein VHM90_16770 [Phycisphaerae bacterium]|jgi:uncharacterized membrane protein|nr:hypothetical protein [Phycisphaerae bacterium]
MTTQLMFAWFVRFLHIASAIGAIGAPFFVRYALMPAAGKTLEDDVHSKLRDAINARWKHAVYLFITIFILTGAYQFWVETRLPNGSLITARWRDFGPDDKRIYHMLFGIKVLCAFIIFFLASALAGRSAAFAPFRRNARTTITFLLLLGALVVICSTLLRFLPLQVPVPVQ